MNKKMKTNEKKCKLNKSEFPDCHCDECYHNVEEYLGKVKGKVYLYTGDRIQYMQNKKVTINKKMKEEKEERERIINIIKKIRKDYRCGACDVRTGRLKHCMFCNFYYQILKELED